MLRLALGNDPGVLTTPNGPSRHILDVEEHDPAERQPFVVREGANNVGRG
jgi:hypothetical protein